MEKIGCMGLVKEYVGGGDGKKKWLNYSTDFYKNKTIFSIKQLTLFSCPNI